MRKSKGEEKILWLIKSAGLPDPEREYKFHPNRKWRFDFAYPALKIGIEFEGGIWIRGAHTRGAHFNSDSEKYNEAVMMGWRVLRYSVNTVSRVVDDLKRVMGLQIVEAA